MGEKEIHQFLSDMLFAFLSTVVGFECMQVRHTESLAD
jgi:hypothetical protein